MWLRKYRPLIQIIHTNYYRLTAIVLFVSSYYGYFFLMSDVVSSERSARSGNDYHPVVHTVIFGADSSPPETEVSFVIQVKDDNIVENVESFHLTLENINGALVGQPQKAEVHIEDNDGK